MSREERQGLRGDIRATFAGLMDVIDDEQVLRLFGEKTEAWMHEFARRFRAVLSRDEVPTLQEVRFVCAAGAPAFAGLQARLSPVVPKGAPDLARHGAIAMLAAYIGHKNGIGGPSILERTLAGNDRDATITLADALLLEWGATAFPTVSCANATLSSLVVTSGSLGSLSVAAPWKSFCVPVDAGLLGDGPALVFCHEMPQLAEEPEEPLMLLRVWYSAAGRVFISTIIGSTLPHMAEATLDDLLADATWASTEADVFDLRMRLLAAKIVVGVALALTSETRSLKTRAGAKVPVTAAPLRPGSYVLGLPVRCDLTQHVSDWGRGAVKEIHRSAVRWLVRGHWRQQACGAAHKEHRRTWIAPYWKGPERASALVRAHMIDPPSDPSVRGADV